MRSSLPTTFLSLLPAVVTASAPVAECLKSTAKQLAIESQCGDKHSILNCFESTPGLTSEITIAECLAKAGCTDDAAALEARYLYTFCDGTPAELRKRAPEVHVLRSVETTLTVEARAPGATAMNKRSPTNDIAARQTTAAPTVLIGESVCSTPSDTLVSACETNNIYKCSSTMSKTMVCKSEFFCTRDVAGNQLCMKRQDTPPLSGTIVSVFLGIVLTGIIGSIIFLCCQDRREQKRLRARAEAAAIAKANAIENKRPEAAARAAGPRNISASTAAPSGGPANPFAG